MVCQASALARVGTPSNITPSTSVLRHFLLYTHRLSCPSWHNSSTFSSEHLCPPLRSHSSLCISSPNSSLPSAQHAQTISTMLSGSCPRQIQCPNDSIVNRYTFYPLKTPHILRTIILSALPNLARSSTSIALISRPYTNTLWTQASYIFPFSFKETPLFVKTGSSSLNFPQVDRSLILKASSSPPAHNITPS